MIYYICHGNIFIYILRKRVDSMFSKNRTINAVIWVSIVCSIILAIGAYVWTSGTSRDILDEKSAGAVDGVDEINIKTGSTSISILKSESSEIKARLSGYVKGVWISSEYVLDVTRDKGKSGDKVDIKANGNSSVFIGISNVKLDVYIPGEYANKINIKASSGSIKIEDYSFTQATIETSSGSINADSINAAALDVSTSSGSLNMDEISSESFKAETQSGSLNLKGISVTKEINARTSSGSLNIDLAAFSGKGYFKTSSGSCHISFPDDASIALKASSSSGSISCRLPNVSSKGEHDLNADVNGGKYPVEINTSSGSINVN
jgi:lia operon protein LiaG